MEEPTFDEFSPQSKADWIKLAEEPLSGRNEKPLETSTQEGIPLQPMYFREDVRNQNYCCLRHCKGWDIAQKVEFTDAKTFNTVAQDVLKRGQNAISLCEKDIKEAKQLDEAFENIDLKETALYFEPHINLELVKWFRKRGEGLKGAGGFDPIGMRGKGQIDQETIDLYLNFLAETLTSPQVATSEFKVIGIDCCQHRERGESAVEELASALATANEYFNSLSQRGIDLHSIAKQMHFFFGLGNHFFMELAKFRAFNLLWQRLLEEKKIPYLPPSIGALTLLDNETGPDLHMNILRGTTQAVSAILGGVNSLTILPFDTTPSSKELAERVARNIHLILRDECNFAQVADPAAGSYYLETLTSQLVEKVLNLK